MLSTGIMTDEEFNDIIKSDRVNVFDFSATWCGPCRMMAPVIEDAADRHKKEWRFYQIDIDSAEELASKLDISAVPTIVVFKAGKELGRVSGYMGLDELEVFLREKTNKA